MFYLSFKIRMKFFIHAGRIHTDGSLSKNIDPTGSTTLYLCRAQINNIARENEVRHKSATCQTEL
jgi:hypothetical protein